MTVDNVKALTDAEKNGQTFFSTWRKAPTQTTAANIWFDLSMSPGNPKPNYYIGMPNVFIPMAQSTDGGIPHRRSVNTDQEFLRIFEAQVVLATAVPLPLMILDYLGFYPFIDESDTTEQELINTLGITRYTDGLGVQIMPIVVAGQTGGQTFKVKYRNSDGTNDRWTPQHIITTQAVSGTIITCGGAVVNSRGPFMALQEGDKGVRSIQSVLFEGTGDIGLIALVLVKLIAKHSIRDINAPVEQDFFMDSSSIPEIKDNAYLNLIALPAGTLSLAQIHGYLKTVWI